MPEIVREKPTVERVRALLAYDRTSGVFRWREDRSHNARAGSVAGTKSKKGYWIISVDGRQFYAHHLAWVIEMGEWPAEIDHRNTNQLDNSWSNLRLGNDQLNAENKRRALSTNRSSGVLGVSRQLRSAIKPWKAQIRINGQIVYLGSFATIEEASDAYQAAKRKHHEGYAE
jgi:outer membrane protein assembly factor BamB